MRSWCTPVYSSSAFIPVLAGQGHRTRRAGPPVVFDATGAAGATEAMVAMVASAGRAVQVGMSSEQAAIRVGSLTEKRPAGGELLRPPGVRRGRGGGGAQPHGSQRSGIPIDQRLYL
jgi:hypothetical protein